MKSMRPLSLLTVLLAAVLMTPANSDPMKVEVKQFGGSVTIPKRASGVSYHWPLATEKFVVMTPADYDPNKSYGLVVDIGPSNSFAVPRSWGPGSTNINAVKSGVKFALVTGSGDFRQGDVQDIYQQGYERENFRARLFDVDGMGQQYCSGQTLAEVLSYLDSRP